jgi:hypothetical protein|eukprot:COSAG01_NODE_3550_length_5949_cov_2.333846_4_plen_37_part_00
MLHRNDREALSFSINFLKVLKVLRVWSIRVWEVSPA